jgi:hypothetical protein
VTLIEAYGRGYVTIDVQLLELLVSLLDGEGQRDLEAFCCQNEALKVSTSRD